MILIYVLPLYPVWAEENAPAEEAAPAADAPPADSPEEPKGQVTHTVEEGDTLWDLSGQYLDSPWEWRQIWEANTPLVINPHWIFPGQVLRIPPIVGEPTVAVPPEVTPAPAPASVPTGTAAPPPPPVVQLAPTPAVTPASPRRTVKLTPPPKVATPQVVPTLSKTREIVFPGLLGSGFVSRSELEEQYEGVPQVLATMDGRNLMGQGDLVYLQFEEDRPTVKKGERYLVVRLGDEVEHPETGDDLGFIVFVQGVLEVEDVSAETASARILVSYDYIVSGDLVVALQEVPDKIPVSVPPKGMQGFIVAARDTLAFVGQGHIVFVDLAFSSGVEPGQVFKIVRTEEEVEGLVVPPILVGELVILRVGVTASTALITRSNAVVQVGDRIRSE